jgi:hypothetical protein
MIKLHVQIHRINKVQLTFQTQSINWFSVSLASVFFAGLLFCTVLSGEAAMMGSTPSPSKVWSRLQKKVALEAFVALVYKEMKINMLHTLLLA